MFSFFLRQNVMFLLQMKVRRSCGCIFHKQGVRFSFLIHTYLYWVSQRDLQLPFVTRCKGRSPPPLNFIYLFKTNWKPLKFKKGAECPYWVQASQWQGCKCQVIPLSWGHKSSCCSRSCSPSWHLTSHLCPAASLLALPVPFLLPSWDIEHSSKQLLLITSLSLCLF